MATENVTDKAAIACCRSSPMTQLNTPYPSTAYLTGFLRSRGVPAFQDDLALKLVLRLFTREGLQAVLDRVKAVPARHARPHCSRSKNSLNGTPTPLAPPYVSCKAKTPPWATASATAAFCQKALASTRLEHYTVDEESEDPIGWAFGSLGMHDRAKHLATLYLNDLADVLRDAVDERFQFVRYAESLAASQASFDALADALEAPPNLVDELWRN